MLLSLSVVGSILFAMIAPCIALERAENRYSFSLTTFDPTGKLGQVERAMEAANQGTPIIGIALQNQTILAAPQILPSPLMKDDGTTRFTSITSDIAMAHSGIAADGRVLIAESQRLAVTHEYTFDEEIPIERLLEEMSLLFQEYTMKAGARPFGATLLVAHQDCFYRIDPSGSVTALGDCAIIHGNLERTTLRDQLKELIKDNNSDEVETRLAGLLRNTLQERLHLRGKDDEDAVSMMKRMTILTARLSSDKSFRVRRYDESLLGDTVDSS